MKHSISTLNKDRHLTYRMPVKADLEQRIVWHIEHKRRCGCRDIPEKLKAEMKKRKIKF